MQKKETFATTGTRITVRFFGGWDYEADDVYKKTQFEFPKNVTIKVLEIQVVELQDGSPPNQGVGFSEIELRKLPKRKR